MKKLFILIIFMVFVTVIHLFPQDNPTRIPIPKIDFTVGEAQGPREIALSLQILFLLSILTLAPSILVLTTSFLRIAIVFDFIKKALSLQQVPPNQVVFGLALFLTLFIMWPTIEKMNNDAIQPFLNQDSIPAEKRLTIDEFYGNLIDPLRLFMIRQTDPKYIGFFMNMRDLPPPADYEDVPTYVLLPAFVINELTVGFKMGVLLFLPFIVVDMVIASTLMAMGMIMLPPVMISLPFKIILFILMDGWRLVVQGLYQSFM
ncbi:MAG: flagellar biosynthetic protein FliP [Spirochaetes bacterium GWF1_31_7]|nr:MAG: flagellar biosynthetic protein FliP [Spirochaetes bacterium GWE1_32_154]OHD45260.1 MAG: flagellar biosynthetic protein FliP [Spirochaetes bacterium GWE2_31_10]OHD50555.1 MAG: flagellar biosynthetic protein FliP [Spirochaetes bacterium GWF1_31_7]OHD78575.1 MAG: flagellar biosynthetic protein FliP [Spirochaetes bacterium RIFOXYB1_FULL_32_8]HBI36567.1 flagellar biosynthetic protein FliP [Spirochaetia bacterium]